MGHERWYIALPGECDLLKRAEKDAAFGEWLSHPTIFEEGGQRRWPGSDEIEDQFFAAVKQMNVEHPGIASRVFSLDRCYDAVHYLMSEARRRGEYEADDWGTKAIRGVTKLPPHLTGGQGHRIAYSSPKEVAEIANRIAALTLDSLRCFYAPEQMEAQGVYKFYAGDPDWQWEWIKEYFTGFRTFYEEVALHDEAVLLVVT